jgi:hypothetical protein
MSGTDDSSSIFSDAAHASPKIVSRTPSAKNSAKKKTSISDPRKRIAAINESHRNQLKALKSRFQMEQKLLRDALKKEQEKTKDATVGAKKFYEYQLRQMREDYRRQNDSTRSELRHYLENSVKAIANDQESKITKEYEDRLSNLKEMIHKDFLEELQRKTDEIDQLRAQSNNEIANVMQDNSDKNHRMTQLEIKMREISHYLPDDVQEDLYEQFGFEAELEGIEEEPAAKKRGLLAKLASLSSGSTFKRLK